MLKISKNLFVSFVLLCGTKSTHGVQPDRSFRVGFELNWKTPGIVQMQMHCHEWFNRPDRLVLFLSW